MNLLLDRIVEHFPFPSGLAIGTLPSFGSSLMGEKIAEKAVEYGFSKDSSRAIGLLGTLGVNVSLLALLDSSSVGLGIKTAIVTASIFTAAVKSVPLPETDDPKDITLLDSDVVNYLKISVPRGLAAAGIAGLVNASAPVACFIGVMTTCQSNSFISKKVSRS